MRCKIFQIGLCFIGGCLLGACDTKDDVMISDPLADVEDIFEPRGDRCRIKLIRAGNITVEFKYDQNGRVLERNSNGFSLARYYYNSFDRIDSIAYPGSNSYRIIVWQDNYPTRETLYDNNSVVYIREYQFDNGRIVKVKFTGFSIVPSGETITSVYDYDGENLSSIKNNFGESFRAISYDGKRSYARLVGWTFFDNISFLSPIFFSRNNPTAYSEGQTEFSYSYDYNSRMLPTMLLETNQGVSNSYQFEYENCD